MIKFNPAFVGIKFSSSSDSERDFSGLNSSIFETYKNYFIERSAAWEKDKSLEFPDQVYGSTSLKKVVLDPDYKELLFKRAYQYRDHLLKTTRGEDVHVAIMNDWIYDNVEQGSEAQKEALLFGVNHVDIILNEKVFGEEAFGPATISERVALNFLEGQIDRVNEHPEWPDVEALYQQRFDNLQHVPQHDFHKPTP